MPGERTERATQHRREKARKDGDILYSRELTAAAGILAGAIALGDVCGRTLEAWRSAFAAFLVLGGPQHWEPSTLAPTMVAVRRLMVTVLTPPAVAMAAVATA
ncbi:MAG: EscU/YscU/HrcU family type III secretion system export apparatus switch protein, partial [Chloroflexota bacterium]